MLANVKYYECHITVAPVDELAEDRLERLAGIASKMGFRIADLLMQKTRANSKIDSFMTGKDKDYDLLHDRMIRVIQLCERHGFEVWRAKIEAILYDQHFGRTEINE